MSAQPLADPVALLMPDATAADLDLAERLTRALCIFSSDAADSGSPSVHVQLETAQDELGLYHAGTVGSLLQDLAIHVALESISQETYLMLPAPRRTYAAAWSQAFATTSEEERRTLGLRVPAAATPPLTILKELVGGLAKHAMDRSGSGSGRTRELAAELWRIRLERLSDLAEGRESDVGGALEALLGQLSRMRGSAARALRAAVLSDLMALQLDHGQVAAASETLRRAGPTARQPADCQGPIDILALMVRWLLGSGELPDLQAAIGRCTAAGVAPAGWTLLAAHCRPSSRSATVGEAEALPGARPAARQAAQQAARQAPESERTRAVEGGVGSPAPLTRKALGASALVVSSIQPNGTLKVQHSDVAPGLKSALDGWSSRHRSALAERGTPEHEVGCQAAPLLLLRANEVPDEAGRIGASCIARRRQPKVASRDRFDDGSFDEPSALVVQPILDGDGEPAGLLWIECPHRLVPTARTREAVARALGLEHVFGDRAEGRDVISRRTPVLLDGDAAVHLEAGGAAERARAASSDVRSVWESVVATLKLKTAERRWLAFHVSEEGGEIQMAAAGGDAGERLGRVTDEGTWALRRSMRTGGAVRYGREDSEAPMLHPGAISGAALPLHRNGRVIAVLSLESARRGDAREADVERWFDALQLGGAAVEAALLSAADRRQFDGGFGFAPEDPDFEAGLDELGKLRRSPADVLVVGEVGSGRKTWTRLVHQAFGDRAEGPVRGGTLVTRAAFSLDPQEVLELGRRGDVGTLGVADLEWLSPTGQAALLELASRPVGQRPRILATLGGASKGQAALAPGERAQPSAGVHPQLLRLLGRVVVRRPALRDRRHRIPAAADFLLSRIGQREGVRSPRLDDAAMAHLWRQPWAENLSGLEAVLYSLFLRSGRTSSGSQSWSAEETPTAGLRAVDAALLDTGLGSVPRLPSRSPSPADLAAALWTTRTATGRINKTRAALYLGWDPNTLSLRLKEGELKTLAQARALLVPEPTADGG